MNSTVFASERSPHLGNPPVTLRKLEPIAWRGYRQEVSPSHSCHIERMTLRTEAQAEPNDLITRACFGDFALPFKWCVLPRAATPAFCIAYPNLHRTLGRAALGCSSSMTSGIRMVAIREPPALALYGLLAPNPRLAPGANHFHSGPIVVCSPHVEHWLEHQRVLSRDLGRRCDSDTNCSK
jgi:hypothetical protein